MARSTRKTPGTSLWLENNAPLSLSNGSRKSLADDLRPAQCRPERLPPILLPALMSFNLDPVAEGERQYWVTLAKLLDELCVILLRDQTGPHVLSEQANLIYV